MNASRTKNSSKQLFEKDCRFECEFNRCRGKPATKVIEWYHEDGDHERRMLCDEHAVEMLNFWSAMDWDTGVKISDIEEWKITSFYCGREVSRIGIRYDGPWCGWDWCGVVVSTAHRKRIG